MKAGFLRRVALRSPRMLLLLGIVLIAFAAPICVMFGVGIVSQIDRHGVGWAMLGPCAAGLLFLVTLVGGLAFIRLERIEPESEDASEQSGGETAGDEVWYDLLVTDRVGAEACIRAEREAAQTIIDEIGRRTSDGENNP